METNGKNDKAVFEKIVEGIKEKKYKNIIVLVGAGISVSAGIPDFRTPGTGLYYNLQKYKLPYPEAIFDIEYFRQNPKPFYTLSKELYPGNFLPSKTHYFIKLLNEEGLLLRCYTQNIDTLEDVAGVPQEKLVFAHGSFTSAHCISCRKKYSCEYVRKDIFNDEIPYCEECKGLVKPDIVFFGEPLPRRFYNLIDDDFSACDLLLVMGTALAVQPFGSLPYMVNDDVPRVLINMESVGDFDYDKESNERDVFIKGATDEITQKFADMFGFGDKLREEAKKCGVKKEVLDNDGGEKEGSSTTADEDLKKLLEAKRNGVTEFLAEEEKARLRKDAGEAPEEDEKEEEKEKKEEEEEKKDEDKKDE